MVRDCILCKRCRDPSPSCMQTDRPSCLERRGSQVFGSGVKRVSTVNRSNRPSLGLRANAQPRQTSATLHALDDYLHLSYFLSRKVGGLDDS